jgi:D-alanyl-D-alanine carboxypeptidase (penicillin-binding protein 5/6)
VSDEIARGKLNETDKVLISDDAWRRGGAKSGSSTMFLDPRTEVPVIDLLRGVIIQSGNDASIALAQHLAGSEEAFADVMNQQAQLLGMRASTFRNATGWAAQVHETTARDFSRMARSVSNDHTEHYALYSEKYYAYNGINQPNRNRLLFRDSKVDGLKTGHTKAAGYCLVSSAVRDGMRLIAVVLGTRSDEARAIESQKLLSYGFRYFQTHTLYTKGQVLSEPKVWKGVVDKVKLGVAEDVILTIPSGTADKLSAEIEVDVQLEAPIKVGQVLGQLSISLNGKQIYKDNLVTQEAVEPSGFVSRLVDSVLIFVNGIIE